MRRLLLDNGEEEPPFLSLQDVKLPPWGRGARRGGGERKGERQGVKGDAHQTPGNKLG